MKKILSTVAALGLVAGFATTAAALDFSVKGKYVVEGYHLSNAHEDGGMELSEETASDAYWMHTFQVIPTMKVNDSITMSGDIRLFKEAVWGASGDIDSDDDSYTDLDIDKIYMDYMSPVGKIRLGRVPVGTFGGWFLDTAASANRAMWFPNFMPENWTLLFLTQKNKEGDALSGMDDNDTDAYKVQLGHKGATGEAAIEYIYTRDAFNNTEVNDTNHIGVWGKYKLGTITLEAELAHKFGDKNAAADVDWDAWAGMIDVATTLGGIDAGLMYFYASGDDDGDTGDNEAALSAYKGTGDDFMPLYILTGDHTNLLNDDMSELTAAEALHPEIAAAGVHAFVLHAQYKASDRLTLNGAIGYAWAAEEQDGWDDEYGIEYNVGAAYKLLDNLTYEAHFGYLDTGDFVKGTDAAANTESVYLVSNHLSMKF